VGDDVAGAAGEAGRDRAVAGADLEHEVAAGDSRQQDQLLGDTSIAEEVLRTRRSARLSGALDGHG
jgi:hypothetical protein